MSRLRYVSLALVVTAALLATGTGAFSAVDAERSTQVAVVPDSEAYLGIQSETVRLDNGVDRSADSADTPGAGPPNRGSGGAREEVALLTLTNRFPDPITDLDVTPAEEPLGESHTPPNVVGNSLGTERVDGNEWKVTATVVCSDANHNEEDWAFDVEASGDSFSVETTERVTVECTGEPPANR
jgi:hypothetical protein